MYWYFLFAFYTVFAFAGAIILICVEESLLMSTEKKRVLDTAAVLCFIIAAASIVLIFPAYLERGEVVERKELSSSTKTVFLAELNSTDSDKFFVNVGDQYVYRYYGENEETQIGYAEVEKCKKFTKSTDGKAFLLITTTRYNEETKWCWFIRDAITTEDAYEFCTP